ncbi:uncharacterized protein BDW43DRAFT_270872 [Aspergillus alliaceus]|uniref:uncharacterized protein n=1 Tax=Petromyces alliaceus TaxID=209559 RepID=UPI0012A5E085|nr:uncharacterized protein BDW43DRAFT_270872 [Aspergillus alliaceus]KAB8235093.1 hypothetical protein BDW43DRAFT_270872 [Aspergillus alliaceus]
MFVNQFIGSFTRYRTLCYCFVLSARSIPQLSSDQWSPIIKDEYHCLISSLIEI